MAKVEERDESPPSSSHEISRIASGLSSDYENIIPEDAIGKKFQLCCFPDDYLGVPRGCSHSYCPLSHSNKLLNNYYTRRYIGNFGLIYFDIYRKWYFGIASYVTILAFVLTLYGCLALTPSKDIVMKTYWAGGSGKYYDDSNSEFSMYVGLSLFVYSNCSFEKTYDFRNNDDCNIRSILFTSSECSEGATAEICSSCQNVAVGIWFAAFTNCFGLILALLGAQTRMRRVADVPVQKMLGMWADTWGVITLSITLLQFETECFRNLHNAIDNKEFSVWTGPGMYCFSFCVCSAAVRAIIHWLTPLPGAGQECSCCPNANRRKRRNKGAADDKHESPKHTEV